MQLKGVLKKREIGWYVCVHYISFQSLFTCGGGGERERERERERDREREFACDVNVKSPFKDWLGEI